MTISKQEIKLNKTQHGFDWDYFGILNDGRFHVYVDKDFSKPSLEQDKTSKEPCLKNVKTYSIKTSNENHQLYFLRSMAS